MLICADWATLPDTRSARSAAARWFPHASSDATGCIFSFPVDFYRSPDGFHAVCRVETVGPFPGDWESVSTLFISRARATSTGVWGLTSRTERLGLYGEETLPPEDRARVVPALLATYESIPAYRDMDPIGYSLLKADLLSRKVNLRTGYLHNAAAITLALLFLAALPRTFITTARHLANLLRERREAHRRARGLCPACAYDLRSDFPTGCPECGWNRTES